MESSVVRAFNSLIAAAKPSVQCTGRSYCPSTSEDQTCTHTHTLSLKTGCGLHSSVTKQPRADFFVFWVLHWAGSGEGGSPRRPFKLGLMESWIKWNSRILRLSSEDMYFLMHVFPPPLLLQQVMYECSCHLAWFKSFSLTGLIKISSRHHLSFLLCNFSLLERKAQCSLPLACLQFLCLHRKRT